MDSLYHQLRYKFRAWRGKRYNRREGMKRWPWRYSAEVKQNIIDQFHKLYYDGYSQGLTWSNTYWRGVRTEKCPLDLWIYQEIITELQPDVIIECGTRFGGATLYLADMCELVGKGKVISVDIEKLEGRPEHKRITYVHGSSVSAEVITQVRQRVGADDMAMVILDSDHTKKHVAQELGLYKEFVSRGSYLIVEDTNINGHPVLENFGPGPMEALDEFLSINNEFMIDESKEKFYLTFSPRGFLLKK